MSEKNKRVYFGGSAYLKVVSDNFILLDEDYFRPVPEYDENKITKKPSKLKRLLFTFAIK